MRSGNRGWIAAGTTLAVFAVAIAGVAGDDDGGLKRRGLFGAGCAVSRPRRRTPRSWRKTAAAVIKDVFPGTAAEAAGLKPGDVIRGVDGKAVASPGEFVAAVSREGRDVLTLDLVRDALPLAPKVTLRGARVSRTRPSRPSTAAWRARPGGSARSSPALRPRAGAGSAVHPGDQLRESRRPPRQGHRLPAHRGGVHRGGLRDPPGREARLRRQRGGPGVEVDFVTELDGYRQGLKMLRRPEDVDPELVRLRP